MSWVARELSGFQRRLSLERERWRLLECERLWVRDARSEATWRESTSLSSNSMAVLSGVVRGELVVVGSGVTSQILSMRWEAESRHLGLPDEYGLHVRRKTTGPNGTKKIVRDIWC